MIRASLDGFEKRAAAPVSSPVMRPRSNAHG
jgi:hypothetical protein